VLALLLCAPGLGCKVDLDHFEQTFCKPSQTAPTCLEAEEKNVSDMAWLQTNVFTRNCGGDDCHGQPVNGTEPGGTIVLANGNAYKALLGAEPDAGPAPLVESTFSPAHKLVVPGKPELSYLFFLMRGQPADTGATVFDEPPADTGYMPSANNTLCCQKLDAVERWIRAGARP
jgi:hypothetical protein